ncbi:NAD(P)-dependent alcohol dehydrogenase [Povalibacter sp.]|uniref:NAD(P)-dependent alcohol dehydrogenase n=1 Tax=Povalibacter sp. TaxID=1962978 RepID=UPI0032C23ADF
MTAAVARCYGPPDVIQLEEVAKPVPADDQILIRVHAASVNPLDWRMLRGSPYLLRLQRGLGTPGVARFGADFAGTVAAVGSSVTKFKSGDAVFGAANGALAEYITRRENGPLAVKPAGITFEQAASVNVAGMTALQALRDHGKVQAGDKVLINGASGGVGTFAIQIAKTLGSEVTAVCSTRNVELVRSLGADHVVDYTQADFTRSGQRYDVVIDNVANRSLSDLRRALKADGRLVIIGGAHGNWIAPFSLPLKAFMTAPFVDQKMGMMIAQSTQKDMQFVADLMASGKLTPVIDRTYPLSETAEAIRYLETGRARGKVVVVIAPGPT